MNLGIRGKCYIYTGAAGLIGSAVCHALAQEGAKLVLTDTNHDRLELLALKLRSINDSLKLLTFSQPDELNHNGFDSTLDKVEAEFGRIDGLINCAYPRTSDWSTKFDEIPFDSWQKNVDMHLNSYFYTSQRVALRMMAHRDGVIVNFASIYGLVAPDFNVYKDVPGMTCPAGYSAIKGGICNLTRYLAAYLGPYNIRVNAICPGGVEDGQDPRFVQAYIDRTPLKRMAAVDDVVKPVIFLLSNMSQYITGINLAVDGGWTCI